MVGSIDCDGDAYGRFVTDKTISHERSSDGEQVSCQVGQYLTLFFLAALRARRSSLAMVMCQDSSLASLNQLHFEVAMRMTTRTFAPSCSLSYSSAQRSGYYHASIIAIVDPLLTLEVLVSRGIFRVKCFIVDVPSPPGLTFGWNMFFRERVKASVVAPVTPDGIPVGTGVKKRGLLLEVI